MKAFAAILIGILVLIVVYFGVRWLAGELRFEGFLSRQEGASTSTEGVSTVKTSEVSRQITKWAVDIPLGFTAAGLSPDFGKVEISSLRRPSSSGTGGGFALRAASALDSLLDVTDWKIRANNKEEILIKGGDSYSPPVNLVQIVLRPRTSAVFYADTNSVIRNIELNKCTGYLNNVFTLDPKLPKNCPTVNRSEIITFSGDCQDFIRSLSTCEQPTSAEINRFSDADNLACREFLGNFNYGSCFSEHSKDSNFYSYGWRVWLDERLPFDSKHDRLLLFDEDGLLVDEYVY